jgi:hypothetical protein
VRSRANREAVAEIQSLSENAKREIEHVVFNALMIISGCAQQIINTPQRAEHNQARAKTITRTVTDASALLREMLRPASVDAHLGATEKNSNSLVP